MRSGYLAEDNKTLKPVSHEENSLTCFPTVYNTVTSLRPVFQRPCIEPLGLTLVLRSSASPGCHWVWYAFAYRMKSHRFEMGNSVPLFQIIDLYRPIIEPPNYPIRSGHLIHWSTGLVHEHCKEKSTGIFQHLSSPLSTTAKRLSGDINAMKHAKIASCQTLVNLTNTLLFFFNPTSAPQNCLLSHINGEGFFSKTAFQLDSQCVFTFPVGSQVLRVF